MMAATMPMTANNAVEPTAFYDKAAKERMLAGKKIDSVAKCLLRLFHLRNVHKFFLR